MIGKVIEGRYAGAAVHKLPEKNVLYIQTEDGSKIALSKKHVISIDDVTEQYSSYGRKVLMVMWNDFETSIIQLGTAPSPDAKDSPVSNHDHTQPETKKKRSTGKIIIILFLGILLCCALFIALKFLPNKESNAATTETPLITSEATEVATTAAPTTVPETTVPTEPPIVYADEAFLEAIEKSIEKRMELNDPDQNGKGFLRELVNAELAIIGKYEFEVFLDQNLKTLVNKYIDGLKMQEDSLELSYSEHQIKWHEGLVYRFEALCTLHDKYGVFLDDPTFVSNYVMPLDSSRVYLQALKAIEADMIEQLDGITLKYVDQSHQYAMYTNNTDYDFDVNFYFWFYDRNGVRISENSVGFTNIISGKQTKFTFWCPSNVATFDYEWEIYPYVS